MAGEEVTESGIIVTANTEDFSRWTWDGDTRSSIAAANLVRDTMVDGARIEFGVNDGAATAVFGTFEFEVTLEYPISKMIDYWLDTRCIMDRDGKIDVAERLESEVLLRDLEEAAARLRFALSPKNP